MDTGDFTIPQFKEIHWLKYEEVPIIYFGETHSIVDSTTENKSCYENATSFMLFIEKFILYNFGLDKSDMSNQTIDIYLEAGWIKSVNVKEFFSTKNTEWGTYLHKISSVFNDINTEMSKYSDKEISNKLSMLKILKSRIINYIYKIPHPSKINITSDIFVRFHQLIMIGIKVCKNQLLGIDIKPLVDLFNIWFSLIEELETYYLDRFIYMNKNNEDIAANYQSKLGLISYLYTTGYMKYNLAKYLENQNQRIQCNHILDLSQTYSAFIPNTRIHMIDYRRYLSHILSEYEKEEPISYITPKNVFHYVIRRNELEYISPKDNTKHTISNLYKQAYIRLSEKARCLIECVICVVPIDFQWSIKKDPELRYSFIMDLFEIMIFLYNLNRKFRDVDTRDYYMPESRFCFGFYGNFHANYKRKFLNIFFNAFDMYSDLAFVRTQCIVPKHLFTNFSNFEKFNNFIVNSPMELIVHDGTKLTGFLQQINKIEYEGDMYQRIIVELQNIFKSNLIMETQKSTQEEKKIDISGGTIGNYNYLEIELIEQNLQIMCINPYSYIYLSNLLLNRLVQLPYKDLSQYLDLSQYEDLLRDEDISSYENIPQYEELSQYENHPYNKNLIHDDVRQMIMIGGFITACQYCGIAIVIVIIICLILVTFDIYNYSSTELPNYEYHTKNIHSDIFYPQTIH